MYEYIDFLGPQMTLTINKNNVYKSKIGAITSVFLFMLCFGAFIGFGNDLFARIKPKVTFNRIFNEQVQITEITDNNFLFSIYDQYSDEPILDFERRFTVSFDFYNVTDGVYKINRRINFEKCSQDALEKWEGYFALVSKDSYLCFPKNKTWQLTGTILQGNFSHVRMQLEYCENNTNPESGPTGSNCIPKNETVKFLEGKRIQMHYIIENSLINTFNYSYPSNKVAYTGYANTDASSWSRLTILFKQLIVDTDEGFLVESRKSQKFPAIESIFNEAIYSPQTKAVFSHLIGNSRYKEIYTRTYIKVQDIFAMMGGFISAGIILLKEFTHTLVRPEIINIFNKLLKLQEIQLNDKKIDIKEKDNTQANLKTNINNFLKTKTTIQNINEKSNSQKEYPNLRKNKIINKAEDELGKIAEINKDLDSVSKKIFLLQQQNYKLKLSLIERTICCLSKNSKITEKKNIYKTLNDKFLTSFSFESFIKLKKNTKLMSNILLEDCHRNAIKISMYPKSKFESEINPQELAFSLNELAVKEDQRTLKIFNCIKST